MGITGKRRHRRRRRERKRSRHLGQIGSAKLRERADGILILRGRKIVGEYGGIKMSQVLLDFLDELLETARDDREYQRILEAGVLAWNLAVLSAGPTDGHNAKALRELNKWISRLPAAARSIVHALAEHKKQGWPDIRRLIVDYELTVSATERNVAVTSLPLDENFEQITDSHAAAF